MYRLHALERDPEVATSPCIGKLCQLNDGVSLAALALLHSCMNLDLCYNHHSLMMTMLYRERDGIKVITPVLKA